MEAMGGSIEEAKKMMKSQKDKTRYEENPEPARERSRSRHASDPDKSREERRCKTYTKLKMTTYMDSSANDGFNSFKVKCFYSG